MGIATLKVLRWGDSYGLRIGKRDAERLGLYEGKEAQVSLVSEGDRVEVPRFAFSDPGFDCTDHDRELYGWRSRG